MPFFAHLHELRRRIIYSLIAVACTTCLCYAFSPQLFDFLRRPLAALPSQKMIVLGPLEMFMTYIKIAVTGGLFLASPMFLLQLWLFVAPGLYPHERRWLLPFVVAGSLCFCGGAAFCFYAVLPSSFAYLIDMVPLGVEAHYSVAAYYALILHLMLAFGVVFELPLVLVLLAAAGIVTAESLSRFRRIWCVLALVIGGVLTPTPDPLTQMLMAGPLIVFFELGILGARLLGRQRLPAVHG